MFRLVYLTNTWYGKELEGELDTESRRGSEEVEDIVELVTGGTPVILMEDLSVCELFGIDPDEVQMI